MTGFAAWILDDDGDARRAESAIATALAHTGRMVDDAVLMSWPRTRRSPKLRPAENIPRRAALGDEFWGLYFGVLFFAPQLTVAGGPTANGAAARSAVCPLAAGFTMVGLADRFNQALRTDLRPGGAAFVVLSDDVASHWIGTALAPYRCHHSDASVSEDQLARLREVFGH